MVSFGGFEGLVSMIVRDVGLEDESGGQENLSNSSMVHSDTHDGHSNSGTVLFLFLSFAIGALVRHVLKHSPIPYTVILILVGLAVGAASNVNTMFSVLYDHTALARIDPHLMLYIFLPTLIFESAFVMDVHTFKKTIGQTLILAGPGLLVSTFLTALIAKFIFTYDWSWVTALVLGSILSATDPVAVVAILREVGTSKQLGTIIEGESLLNDGAAIVLFNVLLLELTPGQTQTGLQIVVYLIRVAIGGPVFGYFIAKITIFWLSLVFNDALVEITITLASAYITYYIGEGLLGVSGVLAVVTLGIEINSRRTNISPEVEVFLHRFWTVLSYLANTMIFILVGVVISQQAFSGVEGRDWMFLIVLYIGVMVIRFLVIGVLSPLLLHIGYSITWKQVIVITWGGLRGAVGLALALVVFQTAEIPLETIGSKVLFHTAGIVVLTLIINGSTISTLLNTLGMSDISVVRRLTMTTAMHRIYDAKHRAIRMLKSDRFLADAHWEIVDKKTVIEVPYRFQKDSIQVYPNVVVAASGIQGQCPKCETNVPVSSAPSHKELAQLAEEVRLRMLKAEKTSYWRQFEHGMLGRETVLILINLADVAMDTPGSLIKVKDIQAYWKVPFYLTMARTVVHKAVHWKSEKGVPVPSVKCCLCPYKLVTHSIFDWIFTGIIIINVICVIVELSRTNSALAIKVFEYLNFIFCIIYFAEAFLKLIGLRYHYFLSKWNIFDFILFIFSVVDIIVELSLPEEMNIFVLTPSIFRVTKVLRLLRVGRVLRLIRPAMPLLIRLVDMVINRKLRFGYDIGKGFVVGIEEMLQQFDRFGSMVPKHIANEFHRRAEDSRLDVMKSLGLLRKKHPGVALSVKTHHAIRSVLNHCRDTIRHLLGSGGLDEPDAELLLKTIEVKMKYLQRTPGTLPLPNPNVILLNVPWLSGLEPHATAIIQDCAKLEQFEQEEVIIQNGEKPRGLFIIVSGLVKIFTYTVSTTKSPDPSPVNDLHDDNMASNSTLTKAGHDEVFMSTDYVGTGSVIGEAAVLERCVSNKTVDCETDVQAFFISLQDLEGIMELYPQLEDQLWRIHGIQTATTLLSQRPEYLDWPTSKLLLLCEGAFIAALPVEPIRTFEIMGNHKEVVLIHGEVRCVDTREKLVAPMVVPRNIKYLVIKTGHPRLLLIPDIQKGTLDDTDNDNCLIYQKKMTLLERINIAGRLVWRILKQVYAGVWMVVQMFRRRKVEPERDSSTWESSNDSDGASNHSVIQIEFAPLTPAMSVNQAMPTKRILTPVTSKEAVNVSTSHESTHSDI